MPSRRGKQVRWCFDEDDVPVFDDSTRVEVPDADRVEIVLAEDAHHSFPRRVAELGGVFDIYKRPRADGSEVRKVGIFAVMHLVRCFRLDCRMRNPNAHETSVHELKGRINRGVFGFLGVS